MAAVAVVAASYGPEVTIMPGRAAARLAVFFTLLLLGCSHPSGGAGAAGRADADTRLDEALRASLSGTARTEQERARDAYRHPHETLAFFGLRDDMRVVELWAPEGYYTSILAPVLHDRGQLTAALLDPDGDYPAVLLQSKKLQSESSRRFIDRLDRNPDVYGKVTRVVMKPPAFSFGPEGSADLVVTFRNVHNWIPEGYQDAVFAASFRVLKAGGALGVVDHRGKPGMTPKQIEDTGYVPEDVVVALATKAGFRLAGRSEINANPKDTKDHPDGVWTLPPVYALKDKDRDKYQAIGESDRMTLRFVKP
jgi:predicted methyltransferase